MPVYGLLIAMYYPAESSSALRAQTSLYFMPSPYKIHILLLFTILSVVAPGISLLLMQRQKHIESVELDKQEERSLPIGITVIYCGMLGVFVWMQIHDVVHKSSIFHFGKQNYDTVMHQGLMPKHIICASADKSWSLYAPRLGA